MISDFIGAHLADIQNIIFVSLLFALWRWGGGPERGLAIVFCSTIVAPSLVFQTLSDGIADLGAFSLFFGLADTAALAGLILVALNANRIYPLLITAFQVVAVSAHLVKGTVDQVSPGAHMVLAAAPGFCQVALLLAGLVQHRIRLSRFGSYRDWRFGHDLRRVAKILSVRA